MILSIERLDDYWYHLPFPFIPLSAFSYPSLTPQISYIKDLPFLMLKLGALSGLKVTIMSIKNLPNLKESLRRILNFVKIINNDSTNNLHFVDCSQFLKGETSLKINMMVTHNP